MHGTLCGCSVTTRRQVTQEALSCLELMIFPSCLSFIPHTSVCACTCSGWLRQHRSGWRGLCPPVLIRGRWRRHDADQVRWRFPQLGAIARVRTSDITYSCHLFPACLLFGTHRQSYSMSGEFGVQSVGLKNKSATLCKVVHHWFFVIQKAGTISDVFLLCVALQGKCAFLFSS